MAQSKKNFVRNERVNIVRGLYQHYGSGVYKGPYGQKMAVVKVNGVEGTKNLRLTSLEHVDEDDKNGDDSTIRICREEYQNILANVDSFTKKVDTLNKQVGILQNKAARLKKKIMHLQK